MKNNPKNLPHPLDAAHPKPIADRPSIAMGDNISYSVDTIHTEDNAVTMRRIPEGCINAIVTSPPYNLSKEYEHKQSVAEYLKSISSRFTEYYRILHESGSIFFNVGSYVQDGKVYPLDCLFFSEFIKAGFIPRNRIVWTFGHGLHCQKRFSGRHETILWFTKSDNYIFNLDPVRVPAKYPNKKHYKGDKKGLLSCNPLGKNPSDVWDISNVKSNHPEKTEHPCQFPVELVNRCILSSTDEGGLIYDPYMGSGTTAISAIRNGRHYIGSELNARYVDISQVRISNEINQQKLFRA